MHGILKTAWRIWGNSESGQAEQNMYSTRIWEALTVLCERNNTNYGCESWDGEKESTGNNIKEVEFTGFMTDWVCQQEDGELLGVQRQNNAWSGRVHILENRRGDEFILLKTTIGHFSDSTLTLAKSLSQRDICHPKKKWVHKRFMYVCNLKGRVIEIQRREFFHPWLYSPDAYNGWGWARLKPGARVSPVGSMDSSTRPITCCSQTH